MLKSFPLNLRPPTFPGDEEKTRTARYVNAIALTNVPVLVLFLLVRAATGAPIASGASLILLGLVVVLSVAWVVTRMGYVRLAGFLLVSLIWLATTLLAASGNGVRGSGYSGYFVVILMAGLLLGWRAALGISILSILSGFALVYAEAIGVITFEAGPPIASAIEITVLLIFSAIFVYLIITSLQNALAVSRASARELASTNTDLMTLQSALEQRVAERTADLELARQESESRAADLRAISEVARAISAEQKLDVLLPLVTQLVSEKFKFYHAGIFLLDEGHRFAVLRAANSPGGQKMMERGHRLEVGQTGIVGFVAQAGQPRIALDVGADPVYFDNPDLPATRSEMAVPLKLRGQIIGVLDVQSTDAGAFSRDDADTLAIMADQVAIAIDNARLFGETQQALAEVQSLYAQYLSQEWGAFAQKTAKVGYHRSLVEGRELATPMESDEIRQVLKSGEVLVQNPDDPKADALIVLPIKLRGQVIGVLNVKTPSKGRRWSEDEVNMVKVVSERLALALENARLFEETTRTAEREKLVSDITTSIRSTNDPQAMIEMAVTELRRALGVSRVEIIPQRVISPGADA